MPAERHRACAGEVQDMITLEGFNRLIGLPEHNRLEARDAVARDAGSCHGGPVICPL